MFAAEWVPATHLTDVEAEVKAVGWLAQGHMPGQQQITLELGL